MARKHHRATPAQQSGGRWRLLENGSWAPVRVDLTVPSPPRYVGATSADALDRLAQCMRPKRPERRR